MNVYLMLMKVLSYCCSIASDTESSTDEMDDYVWETEFASNEFYSLHEDAQFVGRKYYYT